MKTKYLLLKIVFLLMVITALPIFSIAQCFSAATNYAVGQAPQSVACEDYNGDGNKDLAVVNNGSNTISILLGNGNGSFYTGFSGTFGANGGSNSIISADFNGDGKMDLAKTKSTSNPGIVSVFIGNGLGGFSIPTDFVVGANPDFVISADFNGDGKVDLAVTSRYIHNISVLLGNGSGGFSLVYNIPSNQAGFTTSGDFNADGNIDLATANVLANSVSIFLGNGGGSFSSPTDYIVGATPLSIVSGDFNGDGKMDLAAGNRDSNNVSILLNNGSGGFLGASNFAVGNQPSFIISCDFNGDGKPDLATSNYLSQDVSVLLGNGNGSFSNPVNFSTGEYTECVVGADFNGDGKMDVAASGFNLPRVNIFLNTGFDGNTSTVGVSCSGGHNGTASIIPTGGNGPFTYSWNTTPTQTTQTSIGLSAGNYIVTVTDATGCRISKNITITQPAAMALSYTTTSVTCFGGSNGTATVYVTANGASPFTYLWSNSQTTQTTTGLSAGNNTVTVTDANGCSISQSISITQPAGMTLNFTNTSTSCSGGNDGIASVSVTGNGAAPYTYLWSTGSTQSSITGLSAGNYSVTVTEAGGCSLNQSITITHASNCPPRVAAGQDYTLIICNNGTIETSGDGYEGQLGNGANLGSHTPLHVNSLTGIVSVAGGAYHSIALKNDGTVWAWGDNSYGELGIGNNISSNVPVQINYLSGITAIAAGYGHSLALKNDGTVWTWGYNSNGQLGNGTVTNSNIPVQVYSLSNIIAIAGGHDHSIALKSNGTVMSWGSNGHDQLGTGAANNADSHFPIQSASLTGIAAIACASVHSLALKNDGTVWAWGMNVMGQLNNGHTSSLPTNGNIPYQVINLTGITAITTGSFTSFALKNDSTVWAWGNKGDQLGNGTSLSGYTSSPVQVNNLSNIKAIGGGSMAFHNIAIKNDGTLYAWGTNTTGEFGNSTVTSCNVPLQLTGWCQSPYSVSEISEQNSISVFPNPTNGQFTINMENIKFLKADVELDIYNVLGEKVYSEKVQNQKTITLNLEVPNGIYIISLKSGEQKYYQKLIKQ